MALWQCPTCGNHRSRRRDTDCTICFFLADLLVDHADGLHADKLNVSCKACRPAHFEELKRVGATLYTRRVMSSQSVLTSLQMIQQGDSPHDRSQSPTEETRRVRSSSHAQCTHEATRSARARCRAQRRAKQ